MGTLSTLPSAGLGGRDLLRISDLRTGLGRVALPRIGLGRIAGLRVARLIAVAGAAVDIAAALVLAQVAQPDQPTTPVAAAVLSLTLIALVPAAIGVVSSGSAGLAQW